MDARLKRCPSCGRRHNSGVLTCDCGTALSSGCIVYPHGTQLGPSSTVYPHVTIVIVSVLGGILGTGITWICERLVSTPLLQDPAGGLHISFFPRRGWPLQWYPGSSWHGFGAVHWGPFLVDTALFAVVIAVSLALLFRWWRLRQPVMSSGVDARSRLSRNSGAGVTADRTWTCWKDGRSFSASYLRTEGKYVVLRRDDGRIVKIVYEALAENDRMYVRSLRVCPADQRARRLETDTDE